MRTTRLLQALAVVAVLAFLLVWVFPLVWTLLTSLKLPIDVFAYPPTFLFTPDLFNYTEVLGGDMSVLADLGTSIIVATSSTAIAMAAGVPMAYAFARLRFRGRAVLAGYTLFTYLIPRIGLVVPMFVIIRSLHLADTHLGLVIVYLSFTLPMSVWLMVSYFEVVPQAMEEAARVDGATRWSAFWHVVLPQVRGGVAATTVFTFVMAWNEFLFAIVLGGAHVRPVTVAMYNFISVEQTQWGPLTATAVIAMLPVVALGLVAQKEIVQGLSAGAVK